MWKTRLKSKIMATCSLVQHLQRILSCSSSPARLSYGWRYISNSQNLHGLEEFFPAGVYESGGPGPKEVKTGRRWHASDLRQKSNNDLHKLWYVLLKEMNMLQTVKAEARRLEVPMPNPERLKKVQKSMAMIKVVIGERERAVQKLASRGYRSEFKEGTTNEDGKELESRPQKPMDTAPDRNTVNENDGNEQVYKNKTIIT